MFGESYVRLILSLAPLVVCLAYSLETSPFFQKQKVGLIFSALLFAASVNLSSFKIWGALPWLLYCLCKLFVEAISFAKRTRWEMAELAILASSAYLPVGGIWALFDQLNFRPLGFSSIIVLLTGVHFHYAGFALPRLTGLWLQENQNHFWCQWASGGVILGVPLVAIGITSTQLRFPFWVETSAVSLLAISALVVSLGQLRWAWKEAMPWAAKFLFLSGGLALAAGMLLATIYGWRHYFLIEWATIPTMYAIHGTLNSLGFCLPGFLAWTIRSKSL